MPRSIGCASSHEQPISRKVPVVPESAPLLLPREAAKRYHPDLFSGASRQHAEHEFKKITEAYRALTDMEASGGRGPGGPSTSWSQQSGGHRQPYSRVRYEYGAPEMSMQSYWRSLARVEKYAIGAMGALFGVFVAWT